MRPPRLAAGVMDVTLSLFDHPPSGNDDSGFSEEKKVALMEDVAESELKICNPPWSAIGTVRTTTTPSGTEEQEGGAKPAVSAAVV